MALLRILFLGLSLLAASAAFAEPLKLKFSELGFPAALSKDEFESLLQRFVDEQHRKSFMLLGDEKDFDHGHFLYSARSSDRPLAILYHTQELTRYPSINHKDRNFIQWVDSGLINNAARYQRLTYTKKDKDYWQMQAELEALRENDTILDKMLDPERLGWKIAESKQWVFKRVDCGKKPPGFDANLIQVTMPAGNTACLTLSNY